jgi:integrase
LYGRRKTEVLKMEWQHIDLENEQYTIPNINSKIKISFVFSLPSEVIETLKEIKGSRRGLVFKNPNNGKIFTNIHKEIMQVRRVSGWEEFTFHSMRNLLASNLHSRGVSSSHISSILGHTNPNTIKQYLTMERTQTVIEDEINKTLYGDKYDFKFS